MCVIEAKPFPFAPKTTHDERPFWEGCAKHKLLFQRCTQCGRVRHPASFVCPHCSSFACDWNESAGRGTLYSYVVFRRAFHPAFEGKLPYVVASVDLNEGVRLLTNITGCDTNDLRCGQAVEVEFFDREEGGALPLFRPVPRENMVR